jgi:hypothetical protein
MKERRARTDSVNQNRDPARRGDQEANGGHGQAQANPLATGVLVRRISRGESDGDARQPRDHSGREVVGLTGYGREREPETRNP